MSPGWKTVDLELSLKPFHDNSAETMAAVCRRMFRQWASLLGEAGDVAVLLWVGDGSEILDYRGEPDDAFEWGHWIGKAEPETGPAPRFDPEGRSIFRRPRTYGGDVPPRTYAWLRSLARAVKEIGAEMSGKQVRVGIAFDPGPEFAVSDFKYRRHPEICQGGSLGANSFVSCAALLKADARSYAGFPGGIPEGTPFGTFLGRQTRLFSRDLGFDYIWFSNGFAFSPNAWNATGAIFDGTRFHPDRLPGVRQGILEFWRHFCEECPDFPIKARGTNLVLGIDLASNGVPLQEIYRACPGLLTPPPNSPWAPINGNLGLELAGWMSRIASLPGSGFPFRFYIHDPWFQNSPWIDRYARQPYDIFLPSAVSRIDGEGRAVAPDEVMLLTVDDSRGRMPDEVPDEVIPHLKAALLRARPDAPGPVVWVYPVEEYHRAAAPGGAFSLGGIYAGDWFVCGAINQGLPLNTVIDSTNFIRLASGLPDRLKGRVWVCPLPPPGGALAAAAKAALGQGASLLFYGSTSMADDGLREMLGLRPAAEVSGKGTWRETQGRRDDRERESPCYHHDPLASGGGLGEAFAMSAGEYLYAASASIGGEERAVAAVRRLPAGNAVGWVRGTTSLDLAERKSHLPGSRLRESGFPAEALARHALGAMGWRIAFRRLSPASGSAVLAIKRHDNAFYLCSHQPDMTTQPSIGTPFGAPLPVGVDAQISDGAAFLHLPRSGHAECRVFVRQEGGAVLSCQEKPSVDPDVVRRLQVSGLNGAEVVFFPSLSAVRGTKIIRDPEVPHVTLVGEFLDPERIETDFGPALRLSRVTGTVQFFW